MTKDIDNTKLEQILKDNAELRASPRKYAVEVLGLNPGHMWYKMDEIFDSVSIPLLPENLRRDDIPRRIAVKAGNGVSKTYSVAIIVNWFLDNFGPRCTVITTAPTFRQVEEILWREVKNLRVTSRVPLGGKITATKVELGERWFAIGLSVSPDSVTQQATALQGYHNEYVLVIFDEAAGVLPEIWAAKERLLTNRKAIFLAIGNPPVNGMGDFVDCFRPDSGFKQITISVLDTPNYKQNDEIIPGVSGVSFERSQAQQYGKDSARYAVNILGDIPFVTEGTYYGHQMAKILREDRIKFLPYEPSSPVHTFWDIGDMHTAIVFAQFLGRERRIIDCYEESTGSGAVGHKKILDAKPYAYGEFWTGWDVGNSGSNAKKGGEYQLDAYSRLGINFKIIEKHAIADRIASVRDTLPTCLFDRDRTGGLTTALKNYKPKIVAAKSVEGKPVYRETPDESPYNHYADAFGHLCYALTYYSINGQRIGSPYPILADIGYKKKEEIGIINLLSVE